MWKNIIKFVSNMLNWTYWCWMICWKYIWSEAITGQNTDNTNICNIIRNTVNILGLDLLWLYLYRAQSGQDWPNHRFGNFDSSVIEYLYLCIETDVRSPLSIIRNHFHFMITNGASSQSFGWGLETFKKYIVYVIGYNLS